MLLYLYGIHHCVSGNRVKGNYVAGGVHGTASLADISNDVIGLNQTILIKRIGVIKRWQQ